MTSSAFSVTVFSRVSSAVEAQVSSSSSIISKRIEKREERIYKREERREKREERREKGKEIREERIEK